MRKLQTKYIVLDILFAAINCALYGMAAIYLQMRGLSNTQIGIVTGGGCVLLIFVSPRITGLTQKIKCLTARKLCMILYGIVAVLVLMLSRENMPIYAVMVMYAMALLLHLTVMPMTTNMAMGYIRRGEKLNFGLSRGIGSFTYAVGAVVLSKAAEVAGAQMMMKICLGAVILIIVILLLLPEVSVANKKGKGQPFPDFVKMYRLYIWLLTGFALCYMGAVALNTYLINIVTRLGGDTALFGIVMFIACATELPTMAMVPWLKKRYGSHRLLAVAAILFVAKNIIICLAPNMVVLMVGELLQGPPYGMFMAVIAYFVADCLEEEDQMFGQTCITMFTGGVSSTLGNVLGGALQDLWGIKSMYMFACTVAVIGCGIVLLQIKKKA